VILLSPGFSRALPVEPCLSSPACRALPAQALFDLLWGTDDPAAGTWFGPQALQLAQLASPPLPGS
jgi:hypothetical protein